MVGDWQSGAADDCPPRLLFRLLARFEEGIHAREHVAALGIHGVAHREHVHQLVLALDRSTDNMNQILTDATDDLKAAINMSRAPIAAMNKTVESFNSGVRDFSEFNYNLRGTVERMDVTVRDLVSGLREITRILERSSRS